MVQEEARHWKYGEWWESAQLSLAQAIPKIFQLILFERLYRFLGERHMVDARSILDWSDGGGRLGGR